MFPLCLPLLPPLLFFLCGCRSDSGLPPSTELGELFSAELRALDREEAAIEEELQSLPSLPQGPLPLRIGYSSKPGPTSRQGAAQFIRLDLGRRQRIDRIVLVPVALDAKTSYGFPVNWRLELADDASFEEPVVVADYTTRDFPNPGIYPVNVPVNGIFAQFVRLTVTRLHNDVLALGEMMVLQGNRNLAADLNAGEAIRTKDSDENPPRWSVGNLVDGQSILGMPLGIVPSHTEGYKSAPASRADTTKWVQVDLGEERIIDEVRLLPARSGELLSRFGFGFPVRFKVETSSDPEFKTAALIEDVRQLNPYENPVIVRAPRVKGRYVRVTASRLSQGIDEFILALSELEVYSDGENVARGAPVSALDSQETGIWSTRFLTDGFTSLKNILPWPEYLAGLERRRELEKRLESLPQLRRKLTRQVLHRLVLWTVAGAGALGMLWVAGVWRHRRLRRQEMEQLRRRIARDVHDEIGSGLGTIALLSQMACDDARNSETAREDFREINRLSREITESLRDIVWFIRPGTRTVEDLAQRLRETTASMLGAVPHQFEADPVISTHELPLEFKRQVLLFFKEALHNLIRHAAATHALVHVGGDQRRFTLRVEDNGRGFDAAKRSSGAGLTGMQQRAATLGGSLTVDSAPGRGTRLRLEVPWPKRGGL